MRQRLSTLSTLLLAAVVLLGALNLFQISRQIREARLELKSQASTPPREPPKPKLSSPFHLVVVYSYFLNETILEEDTKNLNFFLKLGVYQNVSSVDYIFLVASEKPEERAEQSKELFSLVSNAYNVHIKQIDNSGIYDLCNYLRLISSPEFDELTQKKNTTHVFFINATLRGPFMPLYVAPEPWWNPFLRQMAASPHTVLVGSYMSCELRPHIQTMNLFMDLRGISIAKSHWNCPSEQIKTNWDMRKKWIVDNEVVRKPQPLSFLEISFRFLKAHVHCGPSHVVWCRDYQPRFFNLALHFER